MNNAGVAKWSKWRRRQAQRNPLKWNSAWIEWKMGYVAAATCASALFVLVAELKFVFIWWPAMMRHSAFMRHHLVCLKFSHWIQTINLSGLCGSSHMTHSNGWINAEWKQVNGKQQTNHSFLFELIQIKIMIVSAKPFIQPRVRVSGVVCATRAIWFDQIKFMGYEQLLMATQWN